ncbi:ABC transporter ATP-binding protein [Peptostreptococcus canis]|uniref:ABC transporter ATP-binding protein n=1 Tax=Peptostreptococcus canis TaxID=1159213 RepID=A0ABR6TIX5_9FIRM|nr:ABC transporter ATP-binding protein [Peptostreptococcus canis]MBC2575370.1 ABC transporter ATP-binding protein [Peptostreptococcus canis]MBP1997447.1 osmoprotectant transport system ATP-binding protein [Peptostreptococcus canis]
MGEIVYENVSKSYNEKTIIKNFNLNIYKGEFLTIIGASGCGKTTLMKMINGLVLPDKGRILVNGKDISQVDIIELRRGIGYAIQGNVLFPHMNVYENISYVPKLLKLDRSEIDDIVDNMLELVNLPADAKKKYPNELSGGQKQRVGIARALAANHKIILMDEPFGALDAITRNQIQKELKEIHKKIGATIVFITHDISEAIKLGTRVLVLENGEIQQISTPEEIISSPQTDYVKSLIEAARL